MGDFWGQLGQGLARVQEEAARHITPENINRAAQIVRDGVGHAVEQAQQVLHIRSRIHHHFNPN